MKKLFISFILCFISFNLFAEEFSLFPWVCGQKDIYSYCTNKGWQYSSSVSDGVTSLIFDTPETVTYRGNKIYRLRFSFDKNDNLVMQAITFSEMARIEFCLASVLDLMVADKARLVNKSMDKSDLYQLAFDAELYNDRKSKYVILGQGTEFQISIAYLAY